MSLVKVFTSAPVKLDSQDFIATLILMTVAGNPVSMEGAWMVSTGMTASATKVTGESSVKKRLTTKRVGGSCSNPRFADCDVKLQYSYVQAAVISLNYRSFYR